MGCSCFCVPISSLLELKAKATVLFFFHGFWASRLWFSYLQGQELTDWGISPVLKCIFRCTQSRARKIAVDKSVWCTCEVRLVHSCSVPRSFRGHLISTWNSSFRDLKPSSDLLGYLYKCTHTQAYRHLDTHTHIHKYLNNKDKYAPLSNGIN